MAAHAGVSSGVFHECFETAEECYRAAFDQALSRLSPTVAEAAGQEVAWLERVRSGLVAMLGFFDDQPRNAHLLVLETPLSATVTLACRKQLHDLLAALLEREADIGQSRVDGRSGESPKLLATLGGELIVGGVFSVIRTSMLEADSGKLVELAPSLMAFIVAPRLGHAAAQAELEGKSSGVAHQASVTESKPTRVQAISRAGELPIRATHRTTLVLRAIARAPYSNNREVAQAAGLADEGQASKLLARLEHKGVIENVGVGAARGEPNAWLLTAEGRRALSLLGESCANPAPRRASRALKEAL
ncbi:MAG TPA: hypothetical protein VMB51_09140 [Solirubrobacteraceae bacterium]|nr:hypothetical protein [Solirubrobacteraceae bacterium]